MKKFRTLGGLAVFAAAAAVGGSATAQSNVAVYGVLDVGVQHNTNVGGVELNRVETRHEPSYLGFRGREDLGGGLEALFQLEMTVAVNTGINTGGFNRTSIVGLSDKKWGTLTLGRQYDTLIDLVAVDPPRYNSVSAVHVGNWDRTSGTFVNNSIKYRSPVIAGFSGSLLYVMKDGASAVNNGRAVGASATYAQGPLRVSAAYLVIDGVTHRPFNDLGRKDLFGATFATTAANLITDDEIAGIGAYYDFGPMRVLSQYTTTKATAAATQKTERLNTFSIGAVRVPDVLGLRPGIGFNHSTLGDSKWLSAYGILDYYLSKRTDVYVRVVTQLASGPAGQVAASFLEGPSSTGRQTVIGAGISHRF